MNDVDFLPADYVCVQITRKNNTWLRGLFVAVLGLMAVGWIAQQRINEDLVARRDRMISQATAVLAHLDSGDQLMAELKHAQDSERLLNGLRTHIPPTRWLTAIVAALPENVVMTEISAEVDEVIGLPGPDPGSGPRQPIVSAAPADPIREDLDRLIQITPRRSLLISLRGTARDDLEVSLFLTSLHQSRLFDRVQLLFTDQLLAGDKSARSFAIRLRTPVQGSQRSTTSSTAPVATGLQDSRRN